MQPRQARGRPIRGALLFRRRTDQAVCRFDRAQPAPSVASRRSSVGLREFNRIRQRKGVDSVRNSKAPSARCAPHLAARSTGSNQPRNARQHRLPPRRNRPGRHGVRHHGDDSTRCTRQATRSASRTWRRAFRGAAGHRDGRSWPFRRCGPTTATRPRWSAWPCSMTRLPKSSLRSCNASRTWTRPETSRPPGTPSSRRATRPPSRGTGSGTALNRTNTEVRHGRHFSTAASADASSRPTSTSCPTST